MRPGSEYKIDASYLSPNVNMAARLEAATKQFGVSMLLSHDFVNCLSPDIRAKVCVWAARKPDEVVSLCRLVCVHACVRARACVRACVCVCERACERACDSVCY